MLRSLLLLACIAHKVDSVKCTMKKIPVPHESYQSGDFLIGGITSQIIYYLQPLSFKDIPQDVSGEPKLLKFYQHILAWGFAVKEMNMNPKILSNATLGFHIYDSYYDNKLTYRTTLDLLFKSHKYFPNYECDNQKNLMAIIGGLGSDSSFHMADILGLYNIPQLTYGSFSRLDGEKTISPPFYRMVPNESLYYVGLVQLLKHFSWTWVGLFVGSDDSGEHFMHVIEPLLSQHGICLAYTGKILNTAHWNMFFDLLNFASNIFQHFEETNATTVILYGESRTLVALLTFIVIGNHESGENLAFRKVWIMTAQIDFAVLALQRKFGLEFFHGAIFFAIHSGEVPGFQKFLRDIQPDWTKGDGFLKDFWEKAFECSFPNAQDASGTDGTCTGKEKLENLPASVFEMHMTGHSYGIYNAVCIIAYALHAMYSSKATLRNSVSGKSDAVHSLKPWQLHSVLQDISFNNSAGETVFFNEDLEMDLGFDVMNLVTYPNKSFYKLKVGKFDPNGLEGKELVLYEDMIVWQQSINQVPPLSVCNDYCHPGYQKKKKEGEKFCCYDCDPCPEGQVANTMDMENCIECPEDQYPNNDQDECVPKTITFLSYGEPLGISLTSVAVSFSLFTVLVLTVFIKHADTPLVKANNRNITYTLLISLLLSFVCSLLFLGQPKKLNCFFQQAAFATIFSVSVSCVLSKTITVFVAFTATRPGYSMRKWVGKRLTNSVILFCSLIQAGICVLWLGTSPPYPHLDMKSRNRKIVAECKEGSVTMFYTILGYLGLLSFVSLTVAFLARKLPDSFNEAKFITFSMLMFCSVWLCFVPTYLSTNGKYMVAVEVFSILTSSAALLGCIFCPKCYIILLRPELNKRSQLRLGRN